MDKITKKIFRYLFEMKGFFFFFSLQFILLFFFLFYSLFVFFYFASLFDRLDGERVDVVDCSVGFLYSLLFSRTLHQVTAACDRVKYSVEERGSWCGRKHQVSCVSSDLRSHGASASFSLRVLVPVLEADFKVLF